MKTKPEIKCLACNLSVYIALRNSDMPWDWNRDLCGECSEFIPQHIPKEQYGWYKIMYTRLDRKLDGLAQ